MAKRPSIETGHCGAQEEAVCSRTWFCCFDSRGDRWSAISGHGDLCVPRIQGDLGNQNPVASSRRKRGPAAGAANGPGLLAPDSREIPFVAGRFFKQAYEPVVSCSRVRKIPAHGDAVVRRRCTQVLRSPWRRHPARRRQRRAHRRPADLLAVGHGNSERDCVSGIGRYPGEVNLMPPRFGYHLMKTLTPHAVERIRRQADHPPLSGHVRLLVPADGDCVMRGRRYDILWSDGARQTHRATPVQAVRGLRFNDIAHRGSRSCSIA